MIMIIQKSMIAYLLLLFFSMSGSAAPIPIFHIDAKGKTGFEIGNAVGKAIIAQFPKIEAKVDSYLADFLAQQDFDYLVNRIHLIKPNIDLEYQNEVEALAAFLVSAPSDQLGDGLLSLNELWMLQLIPDLARRTNCSGFGVFGAAGALNGSIVGRNLDWQTTEALRSLQAITVYEYKDRSVVNIGFAGYVAIFSGFNSDGLFVAHLDSPLGYRFPEPPVGKRSIVFDLRKVVQTTTRIVSAAQLLEQSYSFSHNILLADIHEVQVLEQPQGMTAQLRKDTSPLKIDMPWGKRNQIAVVNCFVLKNLPSNCLNTVNRYKWFRFRTLARFDSHHQAQVKDIMNIMFDTVNKPHNQIFRFTTVQSMVFTPKDQRLYLYTMPLSGIHPNNPVMHEIIYSVPGVPVSEPWFNNLDVMIVVLFIILLQVLFWGGFFNQFKKFSKSD